AVECQTGMEWVEAGVVEADRRDRGVTGGQDLRRSLDGPIAGEQWVLDHERIGTGDRRVARGSQRRRFAAGQRILRSGPARDLLEGSGERSEPDDRGELAGLPLTPAADARLADLDGAARDLGLDHGCGHDAVVEGDRETSSDM